MMNRRSWVATLLVAAIGFSVPLAAHMKLAKAVPASGGTVSAPLKTVQVWFTEAPDAKVSKLELAGPSGPVKVTGLHAMAKSLLVTVEGPTPPGAYTVAWQAAGNDGHLLKGTFKFTLK